MAAAKKPVEEVVDTSTGEIIPADLVASAKGVGDFVPKTYEDLEDFFANEGGLITFEGSAYMVIDKAKLEGVPFAIVDTRIWHSTKYDNDAMSIMLVTKDELDGRNHFVINDGSTGIMQQVLGAVERSGRKGGFACPNGLRSSTYDVEVTDPFEGTTKTIEATTYYIQ